MSFDPNAFPVADAGLFGLPYQRDESRLVLLPVPWDVTTSYGEGTHAGPEAVLQASKQVDLFDLEVGRAYECGYFLEDVSSELLEWNRKYRLMADEVRFLRAQSADQSQIQKLIESVNEGSAKLNAWIYERAQRILADGKFFALIGGDHSTPYSSIRAVSEKCGGELGLLHIDAHADLRNAYEGFQHSHASIMHNVMTSAFAPKRLVQVGIRDFCEEEYRFVQESQGRIKSYYDLEMKRKMASGTSWLQICDSIMSDLPENVYISFDIDGFEPNLCPNTGTPVPGGLSFADAVLLLGSLHRHGKKLVGFDLNEVAPGQDEWDGNVGSRILYKLCGWAMVTNGFAKPFLT